MKVREIVFEMTPSERKHRLAYQAGKQKLADRANSFGFKKGKLVWYDETGRAQSFTKVAEAVRYKGGRALIRFDSMMSKVNKWATGNKFFKWFTILIDPTVEWLENCAGINALYEAGAFPPKVAKQEASDAMAYYTHIWLSKVITGYPVWLTSLAASRGAMAAVVAVLKNFGIWGKIAALPVGLATQWAVIKFLQSEKVQMALIEKLGFLGWQAADFGAEFVAPLIPKNWTQIYGSGFDAGSSVVKDLVKKDAKTSDAGTGAKIASATGPTSGRGTVSAQELIAQL